MNSSKCFQLSPVDSGHSLKLFKPRCSTTTRQNFFSLRVINELSYNKKSWMHRRLLHSQTGWTDTGEIYGRFQLTGSTAHQHQVQLILYHVGKYSQNLFLALLVVVVTAESPFPSNITSPTRLFQSQTINNRLRNLENPNPMIT